MPITQATCQSSDWVVCASCDSVNGLFLRSDYGFLRLNSTFWSLQCPSVGYWHRYRQSFRFLFRSDRARPFPLHKKRVRMLQVVTEDGQTSREAGNQLRIQMQLVKSQSSPRDNTWYRWEKTQSQTKLTPRSHRAPNSRRHPKKIHPSISIPGRQ